MPPRPPLSERFDDEEEIVADARRQYCAQWAPMHAAVVGALMRQYPYKPNDRDHTAWIASHSALVTEACLDAAESVQECGDVCLADIARGMGYLYHDDKDVPGAEPGEGAPDAKDDG